MALIVRFSDTDDDVIEFNSTADANQYLGLAHTVINPNLSQVLGILSQKYWKLVNGQVLPMTAQEQADKDAAQAAVRLNAIRSVLDNDEVLIAILDIIKDEFNILRKRDRDRAADVAAATSLADLKTRWAAQSTLDDRIFDQLKTAVKNRIT